MIRSISISELSEKSRADKLKLALGRVMKDASPSEILDCIAEIAAEKADSYGGATLFGSGLADEWLDCACAAKEAAAKLRA